MDASQNTSIFHSPTSSAAPEPRIPPSNRAKAGPARHDHLVPKHAAPAHTEAPTAPPSRKPPWHNKLSPTVRHTRPAQSSDKLQSIAVLPKAPASVMDRRHRESLRKAACRFWEGLARGAASSHANRPMPLDPGSSIACHPDFPVRGKTSAKPASPPRAGADYRPRISPVDPMRVPEKHRLGEWTAKRSEFFRGLRRLQRRVPSAKLGFHDRSSFPHF
ncbi:MAG: hypothetical protein RLZZ399_2028 [Verrucomicrobiota bacterium]|jgi:hypothetical protein